jgi:hypothetical protein
VNRSIEARLERLEQRKLATTTCERITVIHVVGMAADGMEDDSEPITFTVNKPKGEVHDKKP